jgi:DNA-binding NtrC family response regulator
VSPAARRERPPARVLVVEDNGGLRLGLVTALREAGDLVEEEASGSAAIERLGNPAVAPYDAVVTDVRLPGADGLAVLRAARRRDPRTRVIVTTAYGTIETAVEAMRLGAFDFLQKPFELEQLERALARALREPAPRDRAKARGGGTGGEAIVAESASMREAIALALRVAETRSTVLVTGETGTGKEIIAGLIHDASPRAPRPFVKVNCAALPETLLESELFGHERGAFTGADRQRVGRFEEASGGTLFLDEIGEMSPATQVKLLRVLQDQEFYRLGGSRPLRTDARIVAATNRDLERALAEGRFREDLYFRLDVIAIPLRPLRERPEDAAALARHFLARFARELDRPGLALTPAALERIRGHAWPGNVRELRNLMERAVLMSRTRRIEAHDLPFGESLAERDPTGLRLELPPEGVSLGEVERALVLAALQRTGFVQKDAARLLRVSRRKLHYRIRRLGITHPSWRRNRPRSGEEGRSS